MAYDGLNILSVFDILPPIDPTAAEEYGPKFGLIAGVIA